MSDLLLEVNCIGIDPGMGRVALTENSATASWETCVFEYKQKRPTDRLFELRATTSDWQQGIYPTVLALEAPMGRLQGASRWLPAFWWEITTMFEHYAAAYHNASPYAHDWEPGALPALLCLDPSPSTIKQFVTGKGNANKTTMVVNIVRHWRDELPGNLLPAVEAGDLEKICDELESYAMARMAECAAQVTLGEVGNEWHSYQVDATIKCLESTARMIVPSEEMRE